MNWIANEHFAYAAVAVFGTLAAVWFISFAARLPRIAAALHKREGVAGPFINIVGVLFGLTLAFLANDTWSARDRAMSAVFQEADGLRSLLVLAESLPQPARDYLSGEIRLYGEATVNEWPALRSRQADPAVAEAADNLLRAAARPDVAASATPGVYSLMLDKVMEIRKSRDLRVSLSQTHVNPLKWLGMAFLGFLTLLSVAAVHLHNMKAGMLAVVLFALAAAPSAAIVLIQGNPFQAPAAISPAPIIDALK